MRMDIIEAKPTITDTRFFSELMSELVLKAKPVEKKPVALQYHNGSIDFCRAMDNIQYVRDLLGEVEQRKLFAVMCLTPEKISRSNAKTLTAMIKDLSEITDDLSYKVRKLEVKLVEVSKANNKLSDDERERIKKFAGGIS